LDVEYRFISSNILQLLLIKEGAQDRDYPYHVFILVQTVRVVPNLAFAFLTMEETMKRVTILTLSVVMLMLLIASSALAGTADGGTGITLSYPDNTIACEPTFHVSTTGVPNNWTVRYSIFMVTDTGSLSQIGGGEVTDNLDINFEPPALEPSSTETYAVFVAVFNADGVLKTKLSGKWTVTCEEKPPQGGEGCTPGYWRQEQHFDSWVLTGYAPGDDYNSVLGVSGSFDTLLDAVWARGGRENALARHAVAALLNAAHPDVDYAYSVDEVLAGVQDAYASGDFEPFKNALDTANNAGCSLN